MNRIATRSKNEDEQLRCPQLKITLPLNSRPCLTPARLPQIMYCLVISIAYFAPTLKLVADALVSDLSQCASLRFCVSVKHEQRR
jgi:hypothetical protein